MQPSRWNIVERPGVREPGNRRSHRIVGTLLAMVMVGLALPGGAVQIGSGQVAVPVVAHLPGNNGTQWRTDVWVDNPYGDTSSVTLSYYPTAGGVLTKTVQVEGYHGLFFHDIVLETFGLESSKGMLIVSTDGTRVEVRARIYNAGNACGEFGQAIPGLPLDRLSRQGYLSGVTTAAGTRLSIGIANPTDESYSVTVKVYDAILNEKLADHTIDLAPHQLVQLDRVANLWDLPQRDAVSVKINSGDNEDLFYAYASVVRNDTGDATFIFGTTPNVGHQ